MKNVVVCFMSICLLIFLPASATAQNSKAAKKNIVYMDLKYGRVAIMLRPDLAPKHVARFKKLVAEGFYDGLKFHRVIEGFMAQTGDPTGTGTGESPYPDLSAEFAKREAFGRGTLGAARSADIDSANSQFFICFEAAPWLNGKYTIFGKVFQGMQFIDLIKKGAPATGKVDKPDVIVRMELAIKDQ